MMGYYGYGMMGYGMIMMAVMGIIAVLVIVALVRYIQRSGNQTSSNINNYALSILNERYAKGEISDEEYQKKKAEILRR